MIEPGMLEFSGMPGPESRSPVEFRVSGARNSGVQLNAGFRVLKSGGIQMIELGMLKSSGMPGLESRSPVKFLLPVKCQVWSPVVFPRLAEGRVWSIM